MADFQSAMDAIAQSVRDETGVPGLALCIVKGEDRRFSASGRLRADAQEPVARQARFDVSCLMKFFLSVTALKLQATGATDLAADLAVHLPELGVSRGIRPLHLMSHSSGYHGVDITDMAVRWNSRWESFAGSFRGRAQLFAPGAVFNYEHSEHVILGEVLRRQFHIAPSALAHEILLAPAGVWLRGKEQDDHTISPHVFSPRRGYVPARLPPFGPFWEASLPALTLTLDDAATAVAAALADGTIAAELRRPMIGLPEMARSGTRAELPPRHFTAACGLYERGVLGHNGSMMGQTLGFRADPLSGAVAVAGVNAYSTHARDRALRQALALVADAGEYCPTIQDTTPLRHSPEQIFGDLAPPELPGRYVGSYLGEVTVECDGPDLIVTAGPAGNRQSRFRIAADGGGHVIQSRMPVAMRFQRHADGGAVLFLGVHAYRSQQGMPATTPTFDNEARHGIGF